MTTQTVSYVLDSQNRIISTGGVWDEFADENGGTGSSLKDICGRSIWDFIKGDVTRMWLDSVFQYARAFGKTIERPYRCDSPDLKRFMRMRIIPEKEGVLRIEHEILSIEKRSAPVNIKFGQSTVNGVNQRCSICGRVNMGEWKEPHGDHDEVSDGIYVIYTVCEDCQLLMPGSF